MLILLPTLINTVRMGTSMQIVSLQQEEITEDDNVLYNSALVRSRFIASWTYKNLVNIFFYSHEI